MFLLIDIFAYTCQAIQLCVWSSQSRRGRVGITACGRSPLGRTTGGMLTRTFPVKYDFEPFCITSVINEKKNQTVINYSTQNKGTILLKSILTCLKRYCKNNWSTPWFYWFPLTSRVGRNYRVINVVANKRDNLCFYTCNYFSVISKDRIIKVKGAINSQVFNLPLLIMCEFKTLFVLLRVIDYLKLFR